MVVTATATDETWIGQSSIPEAIGRATASLLFGLMVVHSTGAVATDEVIDRASSAVSVTAEAVDSTSDHLTAASRVVETGVATDLVRQRVIVLQTASAVATDYVLEVPRSVITETAHASDEVLDQRSASSLVVEQGTARDRTFQAAAALTEESAVASDTVMGRLRASVLVADTASATAVVLDSHEAASAAITERGIATAATFDQLDAVDIIADSAIAEGYHLGEPGYGQAWTANADTWAMSRYEPYSFDHLAVINGALYGVNDDGVHALTGGSEQVEGVLATGKVGLSDGVLIHPAMAFMEYELANEDGALAEMTVTTTQGGTPASYTYPLAGPQVADELVNGRFKFGKGLRGRHFAFRLRIKATRAYINDLRVEATPTKRRV